MDIKSKLEPILMQVEKPARYIGGELHSVIKMPGDGDGHYRSHFVFAFPDTYEIGMSYLGLQIIYKVLNDMDGVFCERVFAPAADMEQRMRDEALPLFTLESKTPVAQADLLGFTLQYELSYTNVLNMLDLAGIPIRSADRSEGHPFVVAGGPCAYNPEPIADYIDFFMIGDAEESLPLVMKLHQEWKAQGGDRAGFLKSIAKLDGIYVPCFYTPVYGADGWITGYERSFADAPERVRRSILTDLDHASFPEQPIVPFIETVHNRAVVELFRGCIRGCRFCQAGMIYRPVRIRETETIKGIADHQLNFTGYDELSLLSLSTSDYPGIDGLVTDLMKTCRQHDAALSLPSLRLDSFSVHVLEEIQGYRKTGLTFAPEAGTQRLRDVINKSITDADIRTVIEQASELGWFNFKFYFMIGLPTETEEDLDGIVAIADEVAQILRRQKSRSGRSNITISVSNFVPKAHTPFQWFPQCTREEFDRKHKYLKDRLRPMRNVTFSYHGTDASYMEAVLARGDRRTGAAVLEAWRLGSKFDGWRECFDLQRWLQAFGNVGLDPDFFARPEISYDSYLPWDLIDTGVSKAFLIEECQRSAESTQTPDCRTACSGCGLQSLCGQLHDSEANA